MSKKLENSSPAVSKYDSPDGLPVDIVIFTISSETTSSIRKSLPQRELKVLLIKRKSFKEPKPDYPFQGYWALPGGFSRRDEDIDTAALRELKEEANVENIYLEQFGTVYYPGRDSRGWIPSVVYMALVKEELLNLRKAGDDAVEVGLFTLEEIEKLDLAFDHKEIIFGFAHKNGSLKEGVLNVVKRKMLTTSIAKEFLPSEFTISELLQVIKTVVPEFDVPPSNFFRRLTGTKSRTGLIELALDEKGEPLKSDRYSQAPAKLYRFTDNVPNLSIYNSTFI